MITEEQTRAIATLAIQLIATGVCPDFAVAFEKIKAKMYPQEAGKLPSRFQIGEAVEMTREDGSAYDSGTVTGVQFTEGKVHYLIGDDGVVVDSALVVPVA